ncbi:MAG: hypothetical protein H6500_00665 [Candidatus Woesearchaeota archaeon]|nr:hypothetical protein [Nanoarchaeota archaeon]USN44344.1 MAG: hypothetical protein H6500_00665 [Candidatus Woesearchaeota archaeon]
MIEEILLLFGISGIIAIALSVVLETLNKLGKNHITFVLLNVYGSFALFIYALYYHTWLFVTLNAFLTGVGIYSLGLALKKRKGKN